MKRYVDPKKFGLPARTVLEEIDSRTIALIMRRKSRVVMADGRKVCERVRKIKEARPDIVVVLKTSAPVCSKTVDYLESGGIAVEPLVD